MYTHTTTCTKPHCTCINHTTPLSEDQNLLEPLQSRHPWGKRNCPYIVVITHKLYVIDIFSPAYAHSRKNIWLTRGYAEVSGVVMQSCQVRAYTASVLDLLNFSSSIAYFHNLLCSHRKCMGLWPEKQAPCP